MASTMAIAMAIVSRFELFSPAIPSSHHARAALDSECCIGRIAGKKLNPNRVPALSPERIPPVVPSETMTSHQCLRDNDSLAPETSLH